MTVCHDLAFCFCGNIPKSKIIRTNISDARETVPISICDVYSLNIKVFREILDLDKELGTLAEIAHSDRLRFVVVLVG